VADGTTLSVAETTKFDFTDDRREVMFFPKKIFDDKQGEVETGVSSYNDFAGIDFKLTF
jgi:hypothetical protein